MKLLLSKEQIDLRVTQIASQINCDYAGKELVIIMVLKGALCLVADLIRALKIPAIIETVQCSSYGPLGTRRGELQVIGVERLDVSGKDVLIVDDIFDSGNTMTTLINALKKQNPRSIKSCVLLNKSGVEKLSDYLPEYILFTVENLFVVGFGLDYKEKYRGLPGIYLLDSEI